MCRISFSELSLLALRAECRGCYGQIGFLAVTALGADVDILGENASHRGADEPCSGCIFFLGRLLCSRRFSGRCGYCGHGRCFLNLLGFFFKPCPGLRLFENALRIIERTAGAIIFACTQSVDAF